MLRMTPDGFRRKLEASWPLSDFDHQLSSANLGQLRDFVILEAQLNNQAQVSRSESCGPSFFPLCLLLHIAKIRVDY